MRISRSTQETLQKILKSQGYQIRYEKGNFHGGYCLVMQKRMILINKFHPLESKINAMAEIIRELEIDDSELTDSQKRTVKRIKSDAS
ncbi:MAG: hypothetical protein AAF587_36750 [Bacteroidota bacterium]